MAAQLGYVIARNICIHKARDASFANRMVANISWQTSSFSSIGKEFPNRIFTQSTFGVPYLRTRSSFLVDCEEERRLGDFCCFWTMTGKCFEKSHRTAMIICGLGSQKEGTLMTIAMSCLGTPFGFPNQYFVAIFRVAIQRNISPL